MINERIAFEDWLGIKPCGAAHDIAWAAWKDRASLPAPLQATPEPVGEPDTVPLDALLAAERERDYWKTRARAMLDHAEGTCWHWMGDGEDHLESLVNSLPVVIRADQLRELLARPAPGVPEDVHTGDDLPPAGKFVIVWVEGLKAPLRAMWVPDFHLPANEDADQDWAKYSEEHDAYFAPSGWYECNHCDETNWQIHERVLAWSHLPVIDRAALAAAAQAKGGG